MLQNFLLPKLDELLQDHDLEDDWLQQDGTTADT
jgi:hypothetical protein